MHKPEMMTAEMHQVFHVRLAANKPVLHMMRIDVAATYI
jgi:hypothetical protein